ncbi:MAG: YkgJ family cysteine cluster protein [Myxococcota bacterium]
MESFDCQRCGACCKNPRENEAEGVSAYVEIAPSDSILKKKDLVRKLVVLDSEGTPHLRLAPDGRCAALQGVLGRRVSCRIYHHRPSPCRRVEPGSKLCLRYRADHLSQSPADPGSR